MSNDSERDEDYRRVALYRNAKAVGESVDAAHLENADLRGDLEKANHRITMVEAELRVLTERFNDIFVRMVGNGATSEDT